MATSNEAPTLDDSERLLTMSDWPSDAGEMAAQIRLHDWTATSIGTLDGWAPSLRTAVQMMLAAPLVASLAVGPQRLFLYNDAAAPHYGGLHPGALGRPLAEVFAHEFHLVEPFYDRAFAGKGVHVPAQPLDPGQAGVCEVFEAGLTPVRDPDGEVIAVLMIGFARGGEVRAVTALRDSEAKYRALFTASPAPFLILKPDAPHFTITDVNDAYLSATMRTREEVIGRGVFEAYPDNPGDATIGGVSTLRASLEKVLASRKPDTLPGLKYDVARPDRTFEERWWSPINSPALNENGEVAAIIHNANDVTEERRAAAALRQSASWLAAQKEAFQAAMDGAPLERSLGVLIDWMVAQHGDGRRHAFYIADHGRAEMQHVVGMGQDYARAIAGITIGPGSLACGLAVARGEPVVTRDVLADPRWKEWTWLATEFGYRGCWSFPVETASGRLVGSFAQYHPEPREATPHDYEQMIALTQAAGIIISRHQEAEDRAQAEASLRASEEQQKLTLELVPALLWRADPAGEKIVITERWRTYTGQTEAETQDFGWLDAVHPDDVGATRAAFQHAFATGEPLELQHRIRKAGDGYRWHLVRHVPLRDEAGAITRWFGAAVDVDELHGLQERQRALLFELQHRVRNTLAVVRSLVRSTAETSDTVEDFASHFEGRLNALARTQMVLTRSPGGGVDLEMMVREELLAQAPAMDQVKVEGPDVRLSAKAAEVLTMAVHELATNAVKFGALTSPGGAVAVRWSIVEEQGERWLRLSWDESGVRVLAPAPRREGFGAELVTQRVPYELRGRGSLELRPGGVRAEIAFPMRPGESILQTDAPGV